MQINLMLGILLKLMQGKRYTAAQLSEIFEVSERSVYRYINNLSVFGIPVCTVPGKNGGIYLSNNMKIDKLPFTREELQTLISLIEMDKTPNMQNLKTKLDFLIMNTY